MGKKTYIVTFTLKGVKGEAVWAAAHTEASRIATGAPTATEQGGTGAPRVEAPVQA